MMFCRRYPSLRVKRILPLAKDLQETLLANRETCAGLAANIMIGAQNVPLFLISA